MLRLNSGNFRIFFMPVNETFYYIAYFVDLKKSFKMIPILPVSSIVIILKIDLLTFARTKA